jgi:hypothetical protein
MTETLRESTPIDALRQQVNRIIDTQNGSLAHGEQRQFFMIDLPSQLITRGSLDSELLKDSPVGYPMPDSAMDNMRLTLVRGKGLDNGFSARIEVFPDTLAPAWRLGIGVDDRGVVSYQRGRIGTRPREDFGIAELLRILRYEEQLAVLRSMLAGKPPEGIKKAEHALLGVEIHLGHLKRMSGEHILVHALEPARLLLEAGVEDMDVIAAVIGHDIPEDSRFWQQKELAVQTNDKFKLYEPVGPWSSKVRGELEKELGAESAEIIMAVTKLKPDGVEIYTPEHAQYVYQRNIASEVRCVLVKLGDRTHNLQTIDALPVAKQIDTIVESIEYWRILEPYAHHPEYGKAVLSLLNKQWEIIKPRTPRHNIPLDEPRWAYAPVSVV